LEAEVRCHVSTQQQMKLCIEGLESTLEEVEVDNDYLINENKTLVNKMKDFNKMVSEAEELVVRS
jgi:hypothetical protein